MLSQHLKSALSARFFDACYYVIAHKGVLRSATSRIGAKVAYFDGKEAKVEREATVHLIYYDYECNQ